jgi:hypothetical protein
MFKPEWRNAVVRRQILEAREAERLILERGPIAYGMRCMCSAADLEALHEDVPGLELRAAEASTVSQQPIWPEDVSRMLSIWSRGRYGIVSPRESGDIYSEFLRSQSE